MARRRVARQREDRTPLSGRVRRVWEVVTTGLALITAIYLVLSTIEPTRLILERYVLKLNVEVLTAIVAIMLEVAIIAVYQLGRQVRKLRTELAPRVHGQVVYDVSTVVEAVRRLGADGRRGERTLEVLGLTLNTTWPQLAAWLTGHESPSRWRITLYCLDPEFAETCDELPGHWSTEAARSAHRVRALLEEEAGDLEQRRITVDLRTYDFVPVVHGFRLGNGEIFLAYLQWSESGRVRPFEFYERIAPEDTSERANRYRDLFDSWLARAEHRSAEAVPAE
ncbi:hypothetical protein [Amycolatopsis suaedae]|uniref:Uncharacterized protein n=1 Tax=Amycolatopsis suaedae TaxID=2510978 RepID=A0A4Q7J2S0_9PSEU|nr:hypothetical protein [Amycolatopsis suaedae]RZQ60264.1 hypothetical protein EWH70_30235 [Amycolatopsis suaedae]